MRTKLTDRTLNRLHTEVTNLLMAARLFMTKDAVQYRLSLDAMTSLNFTTTTIYLNNILTSDLAKLYMLLGYTHGEITFDELIKNVDDINKDMIDRSSVPLFTGHSKLNEMIQYAEELDRKINAIVQE